VKFREILLTLYGTISHAALQVSTSCRPVAQGVPLTPSRALPRTLLGELTPGMLGLGLGLGLALRPENGGLGLGLGSLGLGSLGLGVPGLSLALGLDS